MDATKPASTVKKTPDQRFNYYDKEFKKEFKGMIATAASDPIVGDRRYNRGLANGASGHVYISYDRRPDKQCIVRIFDDPKYIKGIRKYNVIIEGYWNQETKELYLIEINKVLTLKQRELNDAIDAAHQ